MTRTTYGKLTAGLIAIWFAAAFSASAVHWFELDANRPPIRLLIAVLTPILLFWLWYSNSKPFREFVLSLSPQTLTFVQAWRIAGFVFLALYAYRILPGDFALPAGWGDVAIGLTAVVVATRLAKPEHKTAFIAWQLLGVTDLVVAVGTGAVSRLVTPQLAANSISTAPMTVLPLSLIPTFAVPLLFILHVICIAQARRWPSGEAAGATKAMRSVAV
jgi:hypothetical protein